MNAPGAGLDSPEVLWEDAERAFCRLRREGAEGARHAFIPVTSGAGQPTQESIDRLSHEYELKDYLDAAWALRPAELVREPGRTMLVVDFAGGEPLDRLIRQPMQIGRFLRLAAAMASALGRLHGRGLIHKDIKPANVIVDPATERVWLSGFGIASRLPRERQPPEPPEFIAGTLAYMAPEQTGRVSRSIDSRSDLYSLGVTFYEMLTGGLPFTASEPMEWVHCHIARQPTNPSERLTSIPIAVSAITMKMLSKTAEERYQSAAGVGRDLRRCLSEWNAQGRIHDFAPGDHDAPDRLMIPEKLYGRRSEVDTLLAAFHRIVAGARPELVLVSGYSGIGKSAVVNELQKPLVPHRGLFAAGKFDQYKRDIPYATLAQAFQGLIRPLLSKNEEDLCKWRDALREALDPNGLLMVELVPDLKHIIGEQPPVPELPPQDTQGRFQLVFRRFIGVFARPEHPLVLFLDDLQWLDAATLDLLEELLTRSDLKHLLLIGAYRDNEVSATHPLVRKLDAIRQGGAVLQEIVLAPLDRDDLGRLLADSLRCEPEHVSPLAQLIHEKTTGNPFFAIQFISTLADEGLLAFDYGEGRWSWNLDLIHAKGYTDNVVELMVGKLNRLPKATQKTLHRFASLGNSAGFDVLRVVCQESIEELHDHLWEAVRAGLIFRSNDAYCFLHDRVQEAAYSLIPQELRAETHLRLGTLLAEHTPAERREEAIFEIVNQLNRGSHLITSVEEREKVADLNLVAGRRAKISTAYVSALKYLRAGSVLLAEETWESNYSLMFSIESLLAECELLTGDMSTAENRLSRLAERARSRHDYCAATRLRIVLYTNWDRSDQGLDVFLEWLRRDGTFWSKRPTREEAMREYARTRTLLGGRQIEELVHLPLMTDPEILDTVDVFSEAATPSYFFDEHLSSLVVCRLVGLSLEYGNCDASCFGYVWMAFFAGPRFNNYTDGFRFGQLAYDLVEKRSLIRYQARTYLCMGALVIPWSKHPGSGRELVRRAFDAAYRGGELAFAGYSLERSITISLAVGDPLAEVQKEAENGLAFSSKAQLGLVHAICGSQLGLARSLRGLTAVFGRLDHEGYSERATERDLASDPNLGLAEFDYWVRKLQARSLAGDHASAIDAALNAQRLLWRAAANFEAAEFHLYGALAHAAAFDFAAGDQRRQHLEALVGHHRQIEVWAEHNPVTFENRAAIVGAEIARIEGRVLEAQDLYEKAVRSSHTHGFVHNEAIANERAGCFYAARGFDKIATTYLRDARACYLHWGADGKVRQLEQLYPHLRADKPISEPSTTIQTSAELLDLATVMKVSEALSGEIVLEKLIDTLMRTAIEHAGAERGVLVLPRGDEYRIEAEATTSSGKVEVQLRQASVTAADLSESVFRYALRTKESVLLQDASGENPFAADDYIRKHHARSVLCLPILKQARVLGMLYLENNLTPHAFTPARMAILKLLASEAAISMENARLYRDLAEREARIRRLVDANIIGIIICDVDGRIHEANDAFLRMVGYEREDLVSQSIRWTDMTPPEWRVRDQQQLVPELKTTGSLQPFEKEFFRRDGSRVPVLIGVANFEDGGHQGVAFVLDLTERKRASDALRALQMDLAHANRLATMGQLAASIAHEVNQPIGAARNNAHAALRFLARDPPELAEVSEALECVVSDTYRAGGIISRIRDQVRKVPPRKESVDLNDAIGDVMALVRGELSKNQVSIETQLAQRLPPVHGDRVQLQQVMLNLILNAIEAMGGVDAEVRKLVICTESSPPKGLLVTIGDSGPGIAPEDRERVFESFYTTKASGVGIGLSICRSIIDAHDGRLWADAHQPRGAAFRFTLPALF
ncbi:trifunctional serine/threonine-protein kinase/ATP-binding protein/sensor histidine kinase [Variovorax sp. DT-64]|uniref:trifunctional serine/threonine-protein kinase/ATP-binding protein/sensor histidine kinase n=1 Tax=Variovorax sp. DT-64 TaxID=3396160 RepID=UPI003F1DBF39